jgi:regulator of replication initiation timing
LFLYSLFSLTSTIDTLTASTDPSYPVQAREAWLAELKKEYKETVEENKALKNELEQVANELLSQARQRSVREHHDRDRMGFGALSCKV